MPYCDGTSRHLLVPSRGTPCHGSAKHCAKANPERDPANQGLCFVMGRASCSEPVRFVLRESSTKTERRVGYWITEKDQSLRIGVSHHRYYAIGLNGKEMTDDFF